MKKKFAFYFMIFVLMAFAACESHFIYYPERTILSTPEEIGLAYQEIDLISSDGVRISAWWIPSDIDKAVVIFCHGNAGNISHRLDTIRILNRLGLSALIFDYRGYGRSEGSPSEDGTYLDVSACRDYLVNEKKISPEKIISWGRSLGGAVAAWLAKNKRVALLIIESTFTSVADVAEDYMPVLPTGVMFGDTYNTAGIIGDIGCPVLVVHSPQDDVIPYEHGRKLFDMAKEPKEFLEIFGSHNKGFIESQKKYNSRIKNFIEKYVK